MTMSPKNHFRVDLIPCVDEISLDHFTELAEIAVFIYPRDREDVLRTELNAFGPRRIVSLHYHDGPNSFSLPPVAGFHLIGVEFPRICAGIVCELVKNAPSWCRIRVLVARGFPKKAVEGLRQLRDSGACFEFCNPLGVRLPLLHFASERPFTNTCLVLLVLIARATSPVQLEMILDQYRKRKGIPNVSENFVRNRLQYLVTEGYISFTPGAGYELAVAGERHFQRNLDAAPGIYIDNFVAAAATGKHWVIPLELLENPAFKAHHARCLILSGQLDDEMLERVLARLPDPEIVNLVEKYRSYVTFEEREVKGIPPAVVNSAQVLGRELFAEIRPLDQNTGNIPARAFRAMLLRLAGLAEGKELSWSEITQVLGRVQKRERGLIARRLPTRFRDLGYLRRLGRRQQVFKIDEGGEIE